MQQRHSPGRRDDRPSQGSRVRRKGSQGLTLVELMVAFTVLIIGVLGYLQAIVLSCMASQTAREQALAAETARGVMERIKASTLQDVFAIYNTNPNDDPAGPGTGFGPNFLVGSLRAAPNDADGLPGEVLFPTAPGNPNDLRENVVDARFGTPRDLNGNGAVDALNHANDYQLLPIVVRVRWQGKAGISNYQVKTLLVELP
jgi:type II secretory pathway pseudopilin PulG